MSVALADPGGVSGPLPSAPAPRAFVPGELEPIQGPPTSLAAPTAPVVPNADLPINGPPVPVEARPIEGPPAPVVPAAPVIAPVPAEPGEAIADLGRAAADEEKARAEQTRAEAAAQEAKAVQDEKAAKELRERQEAADREMAAQQEVRGRLAKMAEQADADVAGHKFTDYKDTISGGRKITLVLGAALSGLGGAADPMATINKLISQHFEMQKADLSKKENLAKYRQQGVRDFDQHLNDRRLYLDFAERNYREALAREAEAQAARSNNPIVRAKGAALAAKIRQDADAKVVDLSSKWAQAEYTRAHARLLDRTVPKGAKGGGGGGRGDAMAAFAEKAGALNPGDPITPEVIKLGARAGLKPNQIASEVDKYRGSGAKAAKAAAGAEKSAGIPVRDEKGEVVGLWPAAAARSWAKNQEDLRKFRVAGDSIKRLLANDDFFKAIPKGGDWDNAVLGVAAVSNAGTTIPALEHEAGSLKNRAGLVDRDLLKTKLREIEERTQYIKNQLIPVPKGAKYDNPTLDKARAAVAPDSGATDVQRKNAQAYIDAHGG